MPELWKNWRLRFRLRWLAAVCAVAATCLAVAWLTLDRLPSRIRIATGAHGGQYHRFASVLAEFLQERTGRPVEVVTTEGSKDNRQALIEGNADLAVIQGGAVDVDQLVLLTPLYEDMVHIVVRRGLGLQSIRELEKRHVIIGLPGSGMRDASERLLSHYQVETNEGHGMGYFADIADMPEIDAAIVTTGLVNPDLQRLLKSGDFELMPIAEAQAFCVHNPFYSPTVLPRGLYAEAPPIPVRDIPVVATTALLVAREDVSPQLVDATLSALYRSNLILKFPTLIPPDEAAQWSLWRMHSAARSFFNPYEGIGVLANFMESISAAKEVLVALAAGLYLLWGQWRRLRHRQVEEDLAQQKERLDVLLEKTMDIERRLDGELSLSDLQNMLRNVTRTKLSALSELTHEDLRGDRMFSIFLIQCANVIGKIQHRIQMHSTGAEG